MLLILELPPRLATRRHSYAALLRADPCAYCEAQRGGTLDHIVPRSRGGEGAMSNLTGACERPQQRTEGRRIAIAVPAQPARKGDTGA